MTDQAAAGRSSSGDAGDDSLLDDPRVAAAVQEYLRLTEAGQSPDREAFLAGYAELAEPIRLCLEGLDLVQSGVRATARRRDASSQKKPAPDLPSGFPAGYSAGPSAGDVGAAQALPLGDFRIVREIARGGMGIVYEAIQLSLGRRVALKVLPLAATLDARQLQRFKNEAQAAALLHHTHIVPIYAVGSERGVHFYAMQLIDGQSLAAIIEQLRQQQMEESPAPPGRTQPPRGAVFLASTDPAQVAPAESGPASTYSLSAALTAGAKLASEGYIRRAARLMVQAAEALEHAHQAGVVHRDIKPANLLVDASSCLWITDFGLAQLQVDQGLTRSGDFLGTIRYMSPEQTSGQRTMLDHRTDIYSLGATFYELLTLQPVVPGETHQELLYDILHVDPRSPRHWNRAIPVELETILLKSLAKNPAERYASAAEMGADIQRFLDHKPILARPPTLWDRGKKWSRRHPSLAVGAVVLLAVLAAASLISNRMVMQEQRKTEAALTREKQRAQEAEASFQQARRAVDALFRISQEEMSDRPSDAARKRILEVVVGYYQDFLEQRRGDPASQAELAQAQNEVKAILEELNDFHRLVQLQLLADSNVQAELRLSEAQRERLTTSLDAWAQEREALFEEARSWDDEQRRLAMLRIGRSYERALNAVLQADQLRRFQQIAIQSQGLAAFREPEIVRTLGLTAGQRAQIREIEREMLAHFFARPPGDSAGGPPRPLSPRELRHRELESLDRVLALFSLEQKQRWRELTGPDFIDFQFRPFFGPPPGPSRNRRAAAPL